MDLKTNTENRAQTAPDQAAWPAILSLSLGVFGLVTAEFLPVSLLTPISADLGVSVGAAGQSMTMTAIVAAFAGPGIVIYSKRRDRRHVLLGLTLMLVISSLLSALAPNLAVLYMARILLGIGLGGFWALSLALAMRLAPDAILPRAMAVIMTGVSLATVCAAPLGAWIGAAFGWRYAFLLAAVVGTITFLVQLLTVPSLPAKTGASLASLVESSADRSSVSDSQPSCWLSPHILRVSPISGHFLKPCRILISHRFPRSCWRLALGASLAIFWAGCWPSAARVWRWRWLHRH